MSDLTPSGKVNANAVLDGLKVDYETRNAIQQRFAEIAAQLPPRPRVLKIGRLTITWRRV